MNVVVAGLSMREEAAFGIFFGRTMKGWTWAGAPAGRAALLPAADLYVLDLVAWGLGPWSDDAQAALLRLLGDVPAVLLLAAHNRSWEALHATTARQSAWVWLTKPYGTEDMRIALVKAAAMRADLPPPTLPMPRVPPALTAQKPVAAAPAPQPPLPLTPAALTASEADAPAMTARELQTRLAQCDDAQSHVFLRKLSVMLAQDEPFEMRFTIQHMLIVHPFNGWVVSNTPMAVIERVCQSNALAAAVSTKSMSTAEAEDWAQRLGMPLGELDTFVWCLAAVALNKPHPTH